MSTRTAPWPVGAPCWVEVDAGGVDDDPGAVMAFYGAVLGWTYADGIAGHHTATALLDGRPVAGIGTTGALPASAWTLYLAVDDVDAAAEQVGELGGMVLQGPEDAGEAGALAVAVDLGGAAFGLWEPAAHPGIGALAEPGALCWVESGSAEPGASRTFYRGLFGYGYSDVDDGGAVTFHDGDSDALGSIGFAGDELPQWLVHFGVIDVDAAVAAARAAGGAYVGTSARGAILTDPAGARFGIVPVG